MNTNSKNKWRKLLTNIALLVFSMVFAVLLMEVVVRIFYPQKLSFNVSQWDEYVGFSNIPNIEGYSQHPDYEMFVKINSHGLRDREFDFKKPANTIRIGMFGDSFTFGEGVQNDETYSKVLERLLRENPEIKQSGVSVEVLNFGVGKSGTSHQLALYEKEGKKYDLDMVMVGFLSVNDFSDNWNGVFYLENDSLIHNATAYSNIRKIQGVLNHVPFYKWASTHSHLVNIIKKSATIYDDRMRGQKTIDLSVENKELDIAVIEHKQIGLTLRLFEQFKKEATANGSSFFVANFPFKFHKSILDPEEEDPSHLAMCDTLKENLRAKGFELLDLLPILIKLPTAPYYFEHDGHMTPLGHELLAKSIYEYKLPDIMLMISEIKTKNQ